MCAVLVISVLGMCRPVVYLERINIRCKRRNGCNTEVYNQLHSSKRVRQMQEDVGVCCVFESEGKKQNFESEAVGSDRKMAATTRCVKAGEKSQITCKERIWLIISICSGAEPPFN